MGDHATSLLAQFDHGLDSWMNDLNMTVITSFVHPTLLHHTNKIFTSLENTATIMMKSCKNKSKRGFPLDIPQHPIIKHSNKSL